MGGGGRFGVGATGSVVVLQSAEEALKATNVWRCQLLVAPASLALCGLLPASSSSFQPEFVKRSQTQSRCHSQSMLCRSLEEFRRIPSVKWEGVCPTQIWSLSFVLLPMWVSGSQPTSQQQIVK